MVKSVSHAFAPFFYHPHSASFSRVLCTTKIGGLKAESSVALLNDENGKISPNFSKDGYLADVLISKGSVISSKSEVGGDINISGKNVTINNSQVEGGVLQGIGIKDSLSKNITLTVSNDLNILNNSVIRNEVGSSIDSKSQGNAGDIKVTANNISMENGGLSASTYGNGNSGKIFITATGKLTLRDNGIIQSNVEKKSNGNSGGISIQAESLDMIGNAPQIQTYVDSFGKGRAGNIDILTTGDIQLLGSNSPIPVLLVSSIGSDAVGSAGNIKISANSLVFKSRSKIEASTFGFGNGGNIDITLKDNLVLSELSNIATGVAAGGNGNAGNVQVDAKKINLESGSKISTFLAKSEQFRLGGNGNAGNINIKASESINISGFRQPGNFYTGLSSSGNTGSSGQSGKIQLDAPVVNLSNGAIIGSETYNSSSGGSVTINAQRLNLSNGGIVLATAREGSSGSADNVLINVSDTINISGALDKNVINAEGVSSGVYTRTEGLGNGGTIKVNAGSISITEGGVIDSTSSSAGNAGSIGITTNSLSLTGGSEILTSTSGDGNGGNIVVSTPKTGSILITGTAPYPKLPSGGVGGFSSGLIAVSGQESIGTAGKISVNTGDLTVSEGGVISARSLNNNLNLSGGEISINVDNFSLINGGQILSSIPDKEFPNRIFVQATNSKIIDGIDSTYNLRRQLLANIYGIKSADSVIDSISQYSGIFTVTSYKPASLLTNGYGNGKYNAEPSIDSKASSTKVVDNPIDEMQVNISNPIIPDNAQILMPSSNIQSSQGTNLSDNKIASIYEINGGAIRGSNLFHSFQDFSISSSEMAQFNNSSSIENIITRITGDNTSIVEGIIKTNNSANLFFVNPHGLVFGQNAKLNIGGSFMSATANSMKFLGGDSYSAVDPQVPGISLSMIPSVLKFGMNAGDILVDGSSLSVEKSKSISLLGGNITLTNSSSNVETPLASLVAPGGNVNLITIPNNREVSILRNVYSVAESVALKNTESSNVSIHNGVTIDVSSTVGGNVNILANNVNFNRGNIVGGVSDDKGISTSRSGDINVNANNNFTLSNQSVIRNEVGSSIDSKSQGNAGDIKIIANNIFMENGGLSASTYGNGNSGKIFITATGKLTLGDNGIIRSNVEKKSNGNSGGIYIQAESLDMIGNAPQIQTYVDSFGKGRAGSIDILTTGDIQLLGSNNTIPALLVSGLGSDAFGSAGNIKISANSLVFKNRSKIEAGTFGFGNGGTVQVDAKKIDLESGSTISAILARSGNGNGGDINIQASESINISGFSQPGNIYTGITSSGFVGSSGQSGKIKLNAPVVNVSDGAIISSDTYNSSPAGNVTINAQKLNLSNGGIIVATAREGSSGSAGNISLDVSENISISGALDKTVTDAGGISSGIYTLSDGSGNGGTIKVDTGGRLSLTEGGRIDSTSSSAGNAGNIGITTNSLSLAGGSEILTSTSGTGNGGVVSVTADKIDLNNGSIIARTTSANGGDVNLNVNKLLQLRNQSAISASAAINGNGGNIGIFSPDGLIFTVPSENSDITASAVNGKGGNVFVQARNILGFSSQRLDRFSNIDATSTSGSQGIVSINILGNNPVKGLESEPIVPGVPNLSQSCSNNKDQLASTFINSGKGGIVSSAREPLRNNILWSVPNLVEAKMSNSTPSSAITEAQGWVTAQNRTVVLTSHRDHPVSSLLQANSVNCNSR